MLALQHCSCAWASRALCYRLQVFIRFALLMYLSLVHLMFLSFCPSGYGLFWEYLSFFYNILYSFNSFPRMICHLHLRGSLSTPSQPIIVCPCLIHISICIMQAPRIWKWQCQLLQSSVIIVTAAYWEMSLFLYSAVFVVVVIVTLALCGRRSKTSSDDPEVSLGDHGYSSLNPGCILIPVALYRILQ